MSHARSVKGAALTKFTPAKKPANETARLRSVQRSVQRFGLMDSEQIDRFDI